MRAMRSRVVHMAAVATVSLAVPLGAQQTAADTTATTRVAADEPYPATLDYGTGLIDIPVAWVSPNSGDMWLQFSAINIPHNLAGQQSLDFNAAWNKNGVIDTQWGHRFELGFSLYSQNPEWGFFGQALLLQEQRDKPWPAVAVGFRNLGPYQHEDRLLVGHDVQIDSSGNGSDVTSFYAHHLHTSPTLYAVATKSVLVGTTGVASFTIGYGDGLFSDDGKLGSAYNDKGTIAKGLFLGGRYSFHPSGDTRVDLLAENNGWDWNAGVVGSWRGLSLGLYGRELEEGSKSPSKGPLYAVYNYTKFALSLGYSVNFFDVMQGSSRRHRVLELQREQAQLQTEVVQRQERITSLEDALRKLQASELANVAKRRQDLESQIQQERDAINRAEERLKALQQGQQKPPTPPPSGKPPQR